MFIDEGDFLVVAGVFFSSVEFGIGGSFAVGIVGRWEPDDGEGGLGVSVFLEVGEGVVGGDDGALALVLGEGAVV